MKTYVCMLGLVATLAATQVTAARAATMPDTPGQCTGAYAISMEVPDDAVFERQLTEVRDMTRKFHDFNWALVQGYTEYKGYEKDRGFRYVSASQENEKFSLERPAALIYVPVPGRGLHFAAVEYAVPAEDGRARPPEAFAGRADEWTLDEATDEWRLPVWVGINNPQGLFAHSNPCLP